MAIRSSDRVLTYEAAAQQLRLSEGTVRGRLARARERLRRRLVARGVTVPAGLLVAGTTGQVQASIPASLADSTVRIALGFVAGKTARALARGVLNSMRLKQLKIAAVLVLLGISGRYWAWNALAGLIDGKGQAFHEQVAGKTIFAVPASESQSQAIAPAAHYRLYGTVFEGPGVPVAGAKLHIHVGDVFDFQSPDQRVFQSGADGVFAVDLPAGPFQVLLAEPPIGYFWVMPHQRSIESLSVGPDQPVIRREFRVRKGTIWTFQLTRGAERISIPTFVSGQSATSPNRATLLESFKAQADEAGQMRVTLPSEAAAVNLSVQESSWVSSEIGRGSYFLRLFWQPNFRPDELQSILPLDGVVRGFRLIDANERSATLHAPARIEPVNDNGRLVPNIPLIGAAEIQPDGGRDPLGEDRVVGAPGSF
jgi:hypothetical protein